ncbi:AMP-binding protein [Streptomyces sp. M10(2022)]
MTAHETSTTKIRHLDRLLREHDERRPQAPAILAPGLPTLTYRALRRQADRTAQALSEAGVARTDRVAIALPNGPAAAVALVAVACVATAAPSTPRARPASSTPSSRTWMSLRCSSSVAPTPSRQPSRGRRAASSSSWCRCPGSGGRVRPRPRHRPSRGGPAAVRTADAAGHRHRGGGHRKESGNPADTAFLMHTSGTTGRPKLVPQSHDMVCASARNIATGLSLGDQDRCLNVLPLFHGHGLMSPLLATLWAGASVVCPPGFDAAALRAGSGPSSRPGTRRYRPSTRRSQASSPAVRTLSPPAALRPLGLGPADGRSAGIAGACHGSPGHRLLRDDGSLLDHHQQSVAAR